MQSFLPNRVYYEPQALDYELGRNLLAFFKKLKIPVKVTSSHNRVAGLASDTAAQAYREAKKTLVIGVKRGKTFQTCKPSAHFQLPLTTSCPGMCEYCYLATTLGPKPYLRVYVNVDEILEIAEELIQSRSPEITVFEGAATSDPLPVEQYTGSLKKAIEFFGRQPYGRFRFVTKFTEVDSLLKAKHNGHTRFRFSLNCDEVIRSYEHGTPAAAERILAAGKVSGARYPLGFIIAPIFRFDGWQSQYTDLFASLQEQLRTNSPSNSITEDITLEFITHRFTARAKSSILQVFPRSKLPMAEEERKFKYGQFGYGKYLYQPEQMAEIKEFFLKLADQYFPKAKIEYFV